MQKLWIKVTNSQVNGFLIIIILDVVIIDPNGINY